MGDFEDVFGAGADAVDIIDGFSRDYEREKRQEKAVSSGVSNDVTKAAGRQDGSGSWSAAMTAKGYAKGPKFSSYEELSAWDRANARPHVRSRNDEGYQIYFTDGQPRDGLEDIPVPHERRLTRSINDDIPF